MNASNDGSESVDDFLARIASLNARQGQEEAEKSRKLEEEMLQARKERQARRAERARSLSPAKTGPTTTLRLVGEPSPLPPQNNIDPPVALTPPIQTRTLGRPGSTSPRAARPLVADLDFSRPLPPPAMEKPLPTPPSNATSLSRSGTLSWQQRPLSRGAGSVRSRPLSVASIPDSPAALSTGLGNSPAELSRKDIAASLGAKDPSWFRQTPDRGTSSAAYRKNEDNVDGTGMSTCSMRLPGMATDPARSPDLFRNANEPRNEPIKPTSPPSPPKWSSTPRLDQRHAPRLDDAPSTPAMPRSLDLLPPSQSPTLDIPALKPLNLMSPPESDTAGLVRTPSVLSVAGRPPSPTKGLGGFVQSAMMKRSDSVNKRWNVQASPGLRRGDSIAASRPSHLAGPGGLTPEHGGRDSTGATVPDGSSSPLSSSRPTSGHGSGSGPVPLTRGHRQLPLQDELPSRRDGRPLDDVSTPGGTSTSSDRERRSRPVTPPPVSSPLARSPSKALDTRRWSPTKASWLESALNKPESPRFGPVKSEIPAWKANMQRSKVDGQLQQSDPAASLVRSASPTKTLESFPKDKPLTTISSLPEKTLKEAQITQRSLEPRGVASTAANNTSKKDEKPAIPSKRNITPVHLESGSGPSLPSRPLGAPGLSPAAKPDSAPDLKLDIRPDSKSEAKPDPKLDFKSDSKPDSKPEAKPPALKTKPQTPPKPDLRANLKSRHGMLPASHDAEPEFKAVFGKLKKTQTQNYVAPDLLKDNITRGKAGLTVTGGPQPTRRVDEFKESILQKKEAMKAGGGSTRPPESATSPGKPAAPVPEALARRMTLHKTGPSGDKRDAKETSELPMPQRTVNPTTKPELKPRALETDTGTFLSTGLTLSDTKKPQRRQSPPASSFAPIDPMGIKVTSGMPSLETASKPPGPELSGIAARLNPSLAGILSRGGDSNSHAARSTNTGGVLGVREVQQPPAPAGGDDSELTHMTKARAKGPKRRVPKANSSPKAPMPNTAKPKSAGTCTPDDKTIAAPDVDRPSAPKTLGAGRLAARVEALSLADLPASTASLPRESGTTIKARPPVASKSPEVRKLSNPTVSPKVVDKPATSKPATPRKFDVLTDRPSLEATPPDMDGKQGAESSPSPSPSPSHVAAMMPLTPSKSKLNTPKLQKTPFNPATKPATLMPSSKSNGLGLQLDSVSKKTATFSELTPPPEPEVSKTRLASPPSTTSAAPGLKDQLEAFFGSLPQMADKAEFDTSNYLMSQKSLTKKSKTLSGKVWEVTGDGKRIEMPTHQQHILFEDCMYLCVHTAELPTGSQSTEVYLWAGDEVPEAAIEDSQLFCRKVAREHSTKLEVIKQGKESAAFFQALGGIVIVRKNKSSALYMLCGRRHLGHVAFDEADLSASSLCSGLPFLISAKFGKLYLWKGLGSNQEDVGCARLIGMDLGLTGEIEEVSEGEEPANFWECFPCKGRKASSSRSPAQHASSTGGGPPKLYRVEHDRPKSSGGFWGLRPSSPTKQSNKALVEEFAPFHQKDLDTHHIHILDSFAEIYIIVGPLAKKPAEFLTAVQIAQEMAVLSPSIQDRPFLPPCYIVLGEPPQRVQSVFRKWRPDQVLTTEPICVRVEDAIQELGITL